MTDTVQKLREQVNHLAKQNEELAEKNKELMQKIEDVQEEQRLDEDIQSATKKDCLDIIGSVTQIPDEGFSVSRPNNKTGMRTQGIKHLTQWLRDEDYINGKRLKEVQEQ